MIKRHFCAGKLRTSLALEQIFWAEIDRIAAKNGQRWQALVSALLENRPQNVSRASHLRCSLI